MKTNYLDSRAVEILTIIVEELRRDFDATQITFSDAEAEGPTCSEKHDRGAYAVVMCGEKILADIHVEIPSSEGYEGTQDGWAFGFACTAYGGAMGPGGTIGNYTDRVWTRDRKEIVQRLWALKDQAPDYAGEVSAWLTDEMDELMEQEL